MFINLSDVLSELHKPIDLVVPVEMESIETSLGIMPIVETEDAHIVVKHVKQKQLTIDGTCRLTTELPCDRCLEPVKTVFELSFSKTVDLAADENQIDELDEKNYIDGYNLDVDK